jgi:hypothetical protein
MIPVKVIDPHIISYYTRIRIKLFSLGSGHGQLELELYHKSVTQIEDRPLYLYNNQIFLLWS